MDDYMPLWFNDLDKDELVEQHKQSLSNIVMSGLGRKLLNSHGQPLLDIESSYFRPITEAPPGMGPKMGPRSVGIERFAEKKFAGDRRSHLINATSSPEFLADSPNTSSTRSHGISDRYMKIRLSHGNQDSCSLNIDKQHFTYNFRLSLGPFEHHLDVVYNLPKDLSISQPNDWYYAHVSLKVPVLNYDIVLKQYVDISKLSKIEATAGNQLKGLFDSVETLPVKCPPIDINDVTYVQEQHIEQISTTVYGLPINNRTQLQIERLFDDYTRPAISLRVKRMLKFYLSNKTLPLSARV